MLSTKVTNQGTKQHLRILAELSLSLQPRYSSYFEPQNLSVGESGQRLAQEVGKKGKERLGSRGEGGSSETVWGKFGSEVLWAAFWEEGDGFLRRGCRKRAKTKGHKRWEKWGEKDLKRRRGDTRDPYIWGRSGVSAFEGESEPRLRGGKSKERKTRKCGRWKWHVWVLFFTWLNLNGASSWLVGTSWELQYGPVRRICFWTSQGPFLDPTSIEKQIAQSPQTSLAKFKKRTLLQSKVSTSSPSLSLSFQKKEMGPFWGRPACRQTNKQRTTKTLKNQTTQHPGIQPKIHQQPKSKPNHSKANQRKRLRFFLFTAIAATQGTCSKDKHVDPILDRLSNTRQRNHPPQFSQSQMGTSFLKSRFSKKDAFTFEMSMFLALCSKWA